MTRVFFWIFWGRKWWKVGQLLQLLQLASLHNLVQRNYKMWWSWSESQVRQTSSIHRFRKCQGVKEPWTSSNTNPLLRAGSTQACCYGPRFKHLQGEGLHLLPQETCSVFNQCSVTTTTTKLLLRFKRNFLSFSVPIAPCTSAATVEPFSLVARSTYWKSSQE